MTRPNIGVQPTRYTRSVLWRLWDFPTVLEELLNEFVRLAP
jgi:hypothetical protein